MPTQRAKPSLQERARRKMLRQIEKLVKEHPDEVIDALLAATFWPKAVNRETAYERREDDSKSSLGVFFSPDQDVWATVWQQMDPEEFMHSMRYRTEFGGGASLSVRNALLILARAIALDNEYGPAHRKVPNK